MYQIILSNFMCMCVYTYALCIYVSVYVSIIIIYLYLYLCVHIYTLYICIHTCINNIHGITHLYVYQAHMHTHHVSLDLLLACKVKSPSQFLIRFLPNESWALKAGVSRERQNLGVGV